MSGVSTGITCVYQGLVESRAIYISDLQSATDTRLLRDLNITSIVTAARQVKLVYPCGNVKDYLFFPAEDRESYDISKHFDEAFEFVERVRGRGNVLVHCILGVSRSASLVLAYLIRKHGYTLEQALATIRKRRPIINPNPGFMRMLEEYSKRYSSARIDCVAAGAVSGFRQIRRMDRLKKSISLIPQCPSELGIENGEVEEVVERSKELTAMLKVKNDVEEKLQAVQSYYRNRCGRWTKKTQDSMDQRLSSRKSVYLKKGVSV